RIWAKRSCWPADNRDLIRRLCTRWKNSRRRWRWSQAVWVSHWSPTSHWTRFLKASVSWHWTSLSCAPCRLPGVVQQEPALPWIWSSPRSAPQQLKKGLPAVRSPLLEPTTHQWRLLLELLDLAGIHDGAVFISVDHCPGHKFDVV